MDVFLEDPFGRLFCNLFDFDAAIRAHHQDRTLGRSIDDDAEIQFALDLQTLLDEHALNDLAGRSGLIRHQAHADHVGCGPGGFIRPLDDPYAATLAAAAGVDLGLDDDSAATELLGGNAGVGGGEHDLA